MYSRVRHRQKRKAVMQENVLISKKNLCTRLWSNITHLGSSDSGVMYKKLPWASSIQLYFALEFWTSRQSILENHDLKVLIKRNQDKLHLNHSSCIQEQGQSTKVKRWREKICVFSKKNFCIRLWGNTKHFKISV